MSVLTCSPSSLSVFFFFNDTATTELYPLSLQDALPIFCRCSQPCRCQSASCSASRASSSTASAGGNGPWVRDRKSTRLNSSHVEISYAVFCLKKKNVIISTTRSDGKAERAHYE